MTTRPELTLPIAINHDWPEPDWSILDDRRGELPEFSLETLPERCAEWVERAAHGAGVTPAHVVIPALGVTGSLIGIARRAQASASFLQPMTLWTGMVGSSGSGKTPGIEVSKSALSRAQENQSNKIAALRLQHEERSAAAKAAYKRWRADVADAVKKNRVPPTMPLEAEVPESFIEPHLFVTNVTVQRLAVLLQARPRGMLCIIDEMAGLFANLRRLGSHDEAFWLEAWNGGRYIVERMNRPPVVVPHLLVGLVGGFQPDAVARSFAGDQTGLYARFLFGWPLDPPYRPLTDDVTEIEPDILYAITRLATLPAEEENRLLQSPVPLSREGRLLFEEFRRRNHALLHSAESRERDYIAKGPGQVLRLSGVLQYLDWSFRGGDEPVVIDSNWMHNAIRLWEEYFPPHAKAVLHLIGLSDRHVYARTVLRWARHQRVECISAKDVRRNALSPRLDDEQTQAVLADLERRGWVRKETTLSSDPHGRGRPSVRWRINPVLWHDAGNAENAQKS